MSAIYNIDALREGRKSIVNNIEAMEEALLKERGLLAQYDQEITAAEAVMRAHCVVCANENHDWEVISTFPNGDWKRRSCKKCPTKQKLGSD